MFWLKAVAYPATKARLRLKVFCILECFSLLIICSLNRVYITFKVRCEKVLTAFNDGFNHGALKGQLLFRLYSFFSNNYNEITE